MGTGEGGLGAGRGRICARRACMPATPSSAKLRERHTRTLCCSAMSHPEREDEAPGFIGQVEGDLGDAERVVDLDGDDAGGCGELPHGGTGTRVGHWRGMELLVAPGHGPRISACTERPPESSDEEDEAGASELMDEEDDSMHTFEGHQGARTAWTGQATAHAGRGPRAQRRCTGPGPVVVGHGKALKRCSL